MPGQTKSYAEIKKQYRRGFAISMVNYVINIVFVTAFINSNPELPQYGKYILAMIPSIPIGASLLVLMRYLNNCDEYLQAAMGRLFIITTLITLFLSTFWGFLEAFANAPHIELYWVYVVFWALYGTIAFLGKHFFKNLNIDGGCL